MMVKAICLRAIRLQADVFAIVSRPLRRVDGIVE